MTRERRERRLRGDRVENGLDGGVGTDLGFGRAHDPVAVEHGWPAANGSSVLPSFSKRFIVGGALRESPNVERWSWRPPRPGTCDALRIVFDRPFDRHLLDDALCVVDGGGQPIDGTPLTGESETSWSFTPAEPWTTGDVRIVVDDALEDVAGNNFRELLDRDVGHRSVRAATPDRPTQTRIQGARP